MNPKRFPLAVVILLLACLWAQAQSTAAAVPSFASSTYDVGETIVPTTSTLIACTVSVPCPTGFAFIEAWKFYNTTGASITVTITDNSTACGGSACTHSYAIAAGQEWYPQRHGERYNSGIKWSASAAGLEGWITWRQ